MQNRILIADADPNARKDIVAIVEEFGAECVQATNNDEAFRSFLEFGPDMVIVDSLIPRKGAFELISRIRKSAGGDKVGIIVTSAISGGGEIREEAISVWKAQEVLNKPIKKALLLNQLNVFPGFAKGGDAPDGGVIGLLTGVVTETGNFNRHSFPQVFSYALRSKEPRRLSVYHGNVQKMLFFSGGKLAFANSNVFGDTLARYLLQRGLVTEDGFKAALQMVIQAGMKIGEAFVALAQTDPATVDAAVKRNIMDKVLDVFTWNKGSYRILPWAEPPSVIPDGPLDGELLLWLVMNEQTGSGFISDALDEVADLPVTIGRPIEELPKSSEFGAASGKMAALFEKAEGSNVLELLEEAGDEAKGLLYYLILCGFLVVGDDAADYERLPLDPELRKLVEQARDKLEWMRTRNYFQLLGLPVNCNDEAVHAAYLKQKAEFEPITGTDEVEPEALLTAKRAVSQVLERAVGVLEDSVSRREYLASLMGEEQQSADHAEMMKAEASFREGVSALKARLWALAYDKFREAVELNPIEPEYLLYLGIARMHEKEPSEAEALATAEKILTRAHLASPNNAEPLYQLGKVYDMMRDSERAEDYCRRALVCDFHHERAKRLIERITKKKGMSLGAIFGPKGQ